MNTMHDDGAHSRTDGAPDYRPLLRALLAGGGLYLLWRLWRGLGSAFWTVFGLALGLYWMFSGRFFTW